jgi:transcriptional regulator with XRE-family HTH domain
MMPKSTPEFMQAIAASARAKRLALNLTQSGLAQRSGVSLGTLKKFEHTGKISLQSLLSIAMALDATAEFESLFIVTKTSEVLSIDELLAPPNERKRGSLNE